MTKKSKAPTLPKPNIRRIGDLLFWEAILYDQLRLITIGTHTSCLIHYDPKRRKRPWISIHYRRNLDQLGRIDSWLERGEAFLKALEIDLHLLAKALKEDPRLRDIRMIIGLSSLSASWGRNHGFTTLLYSVDEKLIRLHNNSIVGNPNEGTDRLKPLTLFFFAPHGFIKEFYKKKLSRA